MAPSNKVKVSNLPLLFVKGNPTSLELMSLEELQAFLRFMMKCEGNRNELPCLDEIEQPEWWPKEFEFSETILMKQSKSRGKLSLMLKNAIKKCYNYHECAFLIDFCRKLIDYTGGVENLQVVDNKDGTRSLLKRKDKKLLVTFKAENQDYDRERKGSKPANRFSKSSPMKTLDSRRLLRTLAAPTTSDPAMSRCVAELYLCDSCDKDFDSLSKLIEHERKCAKSVEILVEEPTVKSKVRHSQLLNYLRLSDVNQRPPEKKKLKESERPRAISYEKFMDIDLSSPLGSYIIKGSRLLLDQQNPAARSMRGCMSAEDYNNQVEARCPGTIAQLRGSNAYADIRTKYPNVYRGPKKRGSGWVHSYSFSQRQRLARYRDIRRGLTFPSYRLYRKTNRRQIQIKLNKMPKIEVEVLMAKYRERMARLEREEKEREERRNRGEDSDGEEASPLRIQTNDETPDSSPAPSPRHATPVRNHADRFREVATSSPITIETSDSDMEVEEVGARRTAVTSPNSQQFYQVPMISVKLFQPEDEFAPLLHNENGSPSGSPPKSPPKSPRFSLSPLVNSNTMNSMVTTNTRFVPSPLSTNHQSSLVAHSNKTAKNTGRIKHIPNVILKSKQQLSVAKQLTAAAANDSYGEQQDISQTEPTTKSLTNGRHQAGSRPQSSPASRNQQAAHRQAGHPGNKQMMMNHMDIECVEISSSDEEISL